jgi:hypothetical protein
MEKKILSKQVKTSYSENEDGWPIIHYNGNERYVGYFIVTGHRDLKKLTAKEFGDTEYRWELTIYTDFGNPDHPRAFKWDYEDTLYFKTYEDVEIIMEEIDKRNHKPWWVEDEACSEEATQEYED